jgi:integrase
MPKLTKRRVEAAQAGPREAFLWDEELRGFGIRVFPSGRRSYLVQYRFGGRTRRVTLGAHGTLTCEEARAEARQALAAVARGEDPAALRDAERDALTMDKFAKRYLEQHAKRKKAASSARRDEKNLEDHILPRLGKRLVQDIGRQDVARLHHEMRKIPFAANRVLSLLSKMMNLAEAWGIRPDGSNPCRHVERYKEPPRERFLSPSEIAHLGDVLAELERTRQKPQTVIDVVRFLLLTGRRRGEAENLKWTDVDLETGIMRVRTKTGPRSFPLNAPTRELLAGVERRSEFVFPSARGDTPVSLSVPWERIRDKAGFGDLRLHDLRHTHGSTAAGAGLGLVLIGKLLGHTRPDATLRYSHVHDDPAREAAERVGQRIAASLDGKDAEVVSIRPKRSS